MLEFKSHKCIFIGYCEDSKAYRLFSPYTQGVIMHQNIHFNEISPPPNFVEPRVALNFPSYLVTYIFITPSSTYVPNLHPSSHSSSSAPSECFKDTSVVPITTPLPVWVHKTLKSRGSEIGIPSDTQWR